MHKISIKNVNLRTENKIEYFFLTLLYRVQTGGDSDRRKYDEKYKNLLKIK